MPNPYLIYAVPIAALIISVATFLLNNTGAKQLKSEIEDLKKEIVFLKSALEKSEAARIELIDVNIQLMKQLVKKSGK